MRRRSNSHSPISLFTFLDTLVCTMGSLILMLLAMTPKIRERAEARVAAVAEPSPAVAEDEPEPVPVAVFPPEADEREREEFREKRRAAWLKSLADARDALARRQADYRRRRQVARDAGQALKEIQDQLLKVRQQRASVDDASQALTEQETQLAEYQSRIAQKIALTRKNIELLNQRQAAAPNEYALVPYEGSSGTVRRPIYIECSGKGFRFLPENETLSPVDLLGFRPDYNPLLTGAQALLRYWSRRRRESAGTEPEPYVLLLVRPSGISRYYDAKTYLRDLDVNFGYELIEEDWKLHIPDADPLARTILKQTLDVTVQAHNESREALADAGRRGVFERGGWLDDVPPGVAGDGFGGRGSGTPSGGPRRPPVRLGPPTRLDRDVPRLPGDDSPRLPNPRTGGAGTDSSDRVASGADFGNAVATRKGISSGVGPGGGTGTEPGAGGAGTGQSGDSGAKAAAKAGGSRPAAIGGGANVGDGHFGGAGGPADPGSDPLAGIGSGSRGETAANGSTPGSKGTAAGPGSAGGPEGILGDGPASGPNGKPKPGTGSDSGTTSEERATGARQRAGRLARPGARPARLGGNSSETGSDDGSADVDVPLELPPDYVPRRLPGGVGGGGQGGIGDDNLLKPIPQGPTSGPTGESDGTGGGAGGMETGDSDLAPGSAKDSVPPDAFPPRTFSPGSPSPGAASAGSDLSGFPSLHLSDNLQLGLGSPPDLGASGSGMPDPATGSSPAGSPLGKVQMGGPGANIRLGGKQKNRSSDEENDPNDGPRLGDPADRTGGSRSRGPRLWGQAGSRASIGLEHKMEIRVMADRILIGSKYVVVRVGNGEKVEQMVQQVVAGIDKAADRWGEPPKEDYYWVPVVKFVIYPGGNQYYERLYGPLEKEWGLKSTMQFADEKAIQRAARAAAGGQR